MLGRCAAALLCLAGTAALAVELRLDEIRGRAGGSEFRYRVESRATFDLDPEARVLRADGTWVAQNVVGPNQLSRFAHKVEDLEASADGRLTARSYECVEGTFGVSIAVNFCGNYRFGPNGLDDGGFGDDEPVGPPRSLDQFTVTGFDWDSDTLMVTLGARDGETPALYPEKTVVLKLSAIPAAASPVHHPARGASAPFADQAPSLSMVPGAGVEPARPFPVSGF